MVSDEPPLTFTLSNPPPSMPTKGSSGGPIKSQVIRAMAVQLQAEQEASRALDVLVDLVRRLPLGPGLSELLHATPRVR